MNDPVLTAEDRLSQCIALKIITQRIKRNFSEGSLAEIAGMSVDHWKMFEKGAFSNERHKVVRLSAAALYKVVKVLMPGPYPMAYLFDNLSTLSQGIESDKKLSQLESASLESPSCASAQNELTIRAAGMEMKVSFQLPDRQESLGTLTIELVKPQP